MYSNYKIVCCTAAGRMRYMQYIFPYILASDIVDRYDVWVNTTNMQDIECFRMLAARFPKVNLVWQPEGVCSGISSINSFYRSCIEEDTIYIKIDDDIVWMEPDVFEKMVAFRVAHKEAFLVTPHVVNNSMGSYLWQVKGLLNYGKYMQSISAHRILWKRGAFALKLHNYFLDVLNGKPDAYKKLYYGAVPVAAIRFSINFIMWFGSDMAKFNGVVPGDDEEFLSSVVAPQMGKANYYNGDCIVAHFAFGPQRYVLDSSDVLQRYGAVCERLFAKYDKMNAVWQVVQECQNDVKSRLAEVMKMPCPLKGVKKSFSKRAKERFKEWQKMWTYKIEKAKGEDFTVREGDIFKK